MNYFALIFNSVIGWAEQNPYLATILILIVCLIIIFKPGFARTSGTGFQHR